LPLDGIDQWMEVTMALPLTSTPTCSSRPAVAVKVHIVPASGHRVRWAAHDVQFHRTGVKRFHHPLVRDLTVSYEALALPADARLTGGPEGELTLERPWEQRAIAVEVDGALVIVLVQSTADATAADRAAAEDVLASIRFD
jgi:MmyB-like transcription regulator ligand binding domain